jgi:phospholipase C
LPGRSDRCPPCGNQVTGVPAPNISDFWRRTFGDFTGAFRFDEPDHPTPALPDINGPLNLATYETSQFPLPPFPTTDQSMPVQEKGYRKRVG